jgi:predicted nuclease of predicted toxin-antitoxin system
VRFLLDMGVSAGVVRCLLEHGHDALYPRDQQLQRIDDHAIVSKACLEERVMITASDRSIGVRRLPVAGGDGR